jgi:MRG-binding protein
MPPRKKTRGSAAAASSLSTPTPVRDDDAMDIDTPQAAPTTTTTAAESSAIDIHNSMWTDDQEASLFKGVIRWKPAGSFFLLNPHSLFTSASTSPRTFFSTQKY